MRYLLPLLLLSACLSDLERDTAETGEPAPDCTWYADSDGDGYGSASDSSEAGCDQAPAGYVEDASDCDDGDRDLHPGAEEICDGLDNDCDEATDEEVDGDGVGYAFFDGDCDDAQGELNPGAEEVCDGLDNDCDEATDEESDSDGDGFSICDGDCDDGEPAANPDAAELCDGLDNDCDEATDEETDGDGDGYAICDGDCDDEDPWLSPGAVEICDELDNDCDGDVQDCLQCNLDVPDNYKTIQDAIEAAGDGEVVCVEPGSYAESLDFGGRNVHVAGLAGPSVTFVEGDGDGAVAAFTNGEGAQAVLEGFSLSGGSRGVSINGASPTLRNLEIHDNSNGRGVGGGIHIRESEAQLSRLSVHDNHADTHGGGLAIEEASPTISDVSIFDNQVSDAIGRTGGGIYVDGGAPVLQGVEIRGNWATMGGGISMGGDAEPVFESVAIRGNSASSYGGGIRAYDSRLEFANLFIADNETNASGGGGYFQGCSGELSNVVVGGPRAGPGGARNRAGPWRGRLLPAQHGLGPAAGRLCGQRSWGRRRRALRHQLLVP